MSRRNRNRRGRAPAPRSRPGPTPGSGPPPSSPAGHAASTRTPRGQLPPATPQLPKLPGPGQPPPTTGPPPDHSGAGFQAPRTPRDIAAFIEAVAAGECDRSLDALATAVSERIRLLHAAREAVLLATLRRGDRVRINHSARPQYLHGEPGTVTARAGDKILVRLDQPIGRFANGEVRCPPGVLEPLVPRSGDGWAVGT